MRQKAWMKLAERAARTMSQASARLAPAPAATPLTAQTTGFARRRSRRISGLYQVSSALPPAGAPLAMAAARSARSWPAQKPRPAPVSSTARIAASPSMSSSATASWRCNSMVKALSLSGRLRLSLATPAPRSSNTSPAIAASSYGRSAALASARRGGWSRAMRYFCVLDFYELGLVYGVLISDTDRHGRAAGSRHEAARDVMLRSLRGRLIVLLLLLVVAAIAAGVLMIGLFRQSATAQAGQAEAEIGRACDAIAGAYRFYSAGWQGSAPGPDDEKLRRDLTTVVQTALRDRAGIEGGIWQSDAASLAYAFPTYQGSGPKTDLPQAELPHIQAANRAALAEDRQVSSRYDASSQILLVTACPLPGPIPSLTGWTMTRVLTFAGSSYQ